MDNQRPILFIALAFVLLLLWQAWEQEHAPPPIAGPTTNAPTDVSAKVPTASDASTPAPTPSVEALPSGARVLVTTDLYQAEIDSHGGDLRRLALLKYPVAVDQPEQPFPLLQDSGEELFVAQSGLIGPSGEYPTHKVRYDARAQRYALASDQKELRVPLYWRAPDGTRYVKTFVFHRDRYIIDVEYTITNATKGDWTGYLYGQLVRAHVDRRGWLSVPSFTGTAIYTPEDKYQKIAFDDLAAKPLQRQVTDGWIAVMQHYFVGAWMRSPGAESQFYSDVLPGPRYVIGFKSVTPTTVAPGATGGVSASLYIGPKEQIQLEQLAPGMELTVDYGWLTFIADPLFEVLAWIHRWVGNWGWAIIILTILIKLAFYPLSAASYKSMANMKKVQPKMQAIKERFGDDRMKMNEAMMQLYKTEKINPLGGCLPILIQIPVFIALYWVLLDSVEMRQAPFGLWLKDLSSPDPYFVLPLIMGATMYLQQKMNPTPIDPVQQKVFMFLPVLFTAMFLFFPAGLVLYWIVNNTLSIAQQWNIARTIGAATR